MSAMPGLKLGDYRASVEGRCIESSAVLVSVGDMMPQLQISYASHAGLRGKSCQIVLE